MAKDLNTCKTLGDFIEAAIGIYEDSGKTLTVEQAFSEGKRLQGMWNGEPLEKKSIKRGRYDNGEFIYY